MTSLAQEHLETETVVLIPVSECHKSPSQPRRRNADKDDPDLVASIKEKGVRQPIVVRVRKAGGWEIVFGHRRHHGSVLAGRETVPAIVREMTDEEVFEDQLIENIHRSDMHPLDEADGFKRMMGRDRTVQQVADKIGRPASYIAQRLKLCDLGKEVRAALDKDDISLGVAVLLARVPTSLQAEALRSLYRGCSVNEARSRLEETYLLRLDQAPFDVASATLVPKAGACVACPKRTGQQRELFPDAKRADMCIDPVCFRGKLDALWQIRVQESKAGGAAVLDSKAATSALAYNGGFRKLDDSEYGAGGYQPLRKLFGKNLPPITLARDERTGGILELVTSGDVRKLLKQKSPRSAPGGGDDYHKRQDAKDRIRAAAVSLAVAGAVENVQKLAGARLLRLLTYGMIDRAWDDARSAVLRRRGLDPSKDAKKSRYVGSEDRLFKYLKTLSKDEDVAGLGLELILRGVAPSRNGPADLIWGETLKTLGIDFAAIEKKLAGEAKAKKKAKAPAKKRAAA